MLSLMCLCVMALCFGVLSASSVNYSLSGKLSYEIKDAYVEISSTQYTTKNTSITQASAFKTFASAYETNGNTNNLTPLNDLGTFNSLNNDVATYEASNSVSLTYDVDTKNINVILVTVENLSSVPVYVKIIDNREMEFFTTNSFIYRSQDKESLSARSTATFVIGYMLKDKTQTISQIDYGYTFEVGLAENYSPLKFQEAQTKQGYTPYSGTFTKSAYYYVEMGDYFGLPVRWRLIAEKDTSSSKSDGTVAGVYKYSDTKKYKTISTATQDGLASYKNVDGIFLQETMTAYEYVYYYDEESEIEEDGTYDRCYDERTDGSWLGLTSCSFNGFKQSGSNYYKTDDSGNIVSGVLANDYYNSRIREYLNGTNVNKYMEYSGVAHTGGHTSNYLTDLNISTSNSIYSKITARTSMEMKTGTFSSGVWTPSTTDYGSGKTTDDKFWLPSVEEMLTWVAGVSTNTAWDSNVYNKMCWDGYNLSSGSDYGGAYAWLRSGSSSASFYTYNVYIYGDWNDNFVNYYYYGARAAFNLALGG